MTIHGFLDNYNSFTEEIRKVANEYYARVRVLNSKLIKNGYNPIRVPKEGEGFAGIHEVIGTMVSLSYYTGYDDTIRDFDLPLEYIEATKEVKDTYFRQLEAKIKEN